MIWRNPFYSKNSEQQMSEEQFLMLFDSTALQIIETQNLEKVSFVSSSPGAGKTSLFRAFSANILNRITMQESDEHFREIKKHMEKIGVIDGEKVNLASSILSCARGYSIIDEMFTNGRRKQIFFALLNYRIVISLIKSISELLDIDKENYSQISFLEIPQEMISDEINFSNGQTLFDWACKGERELCKYLDSERNDHFEISFVHTTLMVLKLFEPNNIIFDGEVPFTNTLVIFDDFHKLSKNQRDAISEAVYTLKTNVGIWFGQRLEGVNREKLISMDGSLNRDYNPNIVIDNYWPERQRVFYSMLGEIADRRIKEARLAGYEKLSDCLHEKVDYKAYKQKLSTFCDKQRREISCNQETFSFYEEVLNYLEKIKNDYFECSIWYQCIRIKENRRTYGQLSFYLGDKVELHEFSEFVEKHRSIAKYYLCTKNQIPFYSGIENLKVLSSYNVEQFLYFAGAIFDCCRIKNIEKSRKKYLSAEEQERIIKVAVKSKWDDMDYRYINIQEIKDFLNMISKICIESRDAEKAAYAGGAYTGIGIDKDALTRAMKNSQYDKTFSILGACLASRYLERREINNEKTIVFYLNRWLCVYYGLPLAYGGWAKCSIERLSFTNYHPNNKDQIEMDLSGEE